MVLNGDKMEIQMSDNEYMRLAVELAKKGAGWTSPNPLVGAVIVKDGRIIGEGWHHKYGDLHAERDALKNCTEDPAGATIYVTLEPCCHHGKQPPCTDALIEAGIRRVVLGSGDPNPLVGGEGIRILRDHGITVEEGIMEMECREINDIFFHYITTGMPFVALKYAMTMDGKIACYTGTSKWVTGEKAREHVQTLRNRYRGIMVGVGTVLADDPLLNCRMPGGRHPVRIICDSHLRTPLDSRIVKTAGEYETIIASCVTDPEITAPYEERGVTVLYVPEDTSQSDPAAGLPQSDPAGDSPQSDPAAGLPQSDPAGDSPQFGSVGDSPQFGSAAGFPQSVLEGRPEYSASGQTEMAASKISLNLLLRELGQRRIDSILAEGGAQLNWSLLAGGCVQKIYTYIAPKIFGGAGAKSPVGGQGFPDPAQAVLLKNKKTVCLDGDLLIESRID